ncbi:hypothetical protein TBLA_0H01610 [Henningerozyma blattae CBS 6284]|uniref:Septin-type G domain-containing protein n=1 Tax=Henningerozyma blattae (strain ATCC 34711 / CBS 6284 / DSM 70876 / NBRC 10599 / NRRL Y-10934 / UCD 77-7) TaxID=1071380 RepID=I2H7U6_HENB6|nr:hypothetical protein TBLA_0H01610 [Tetrapisispora blattae CBS 6284]CCH62448.1 hypothetical protein TBLA_0H01610 [Tetrapisispora blattae CBS 6284]
MTPHLDSTNSQNINLDSTEVGISNLPNQRYKIVSDQGGIFNLMVCGESGVGKSTFINTLFQTTLEPLDPHKYRNGPIKKTVHIDIIRAILKEKNFKLRLNIIDTPGFADNINNNKSWQPIIEFIDEQHESYMRQEQQPLRDIKFDLRIHAVLYFIRPTGHSLKPIDIETMKRISTRANLIPIIAKSDTLTKNELIKFKNRIRQIIETQQIRIFTPPLEYDGDLNPKQNTNTPNELGEDNQDSKAPNTSDVNAAAIEHARQLIESMPFAIISSENQFQTEDGRNIIGRKYPWGVVEVENDEHCDFRKLRSLLLRTNLLDLILNTEELHYEAYRKLKLEKKENGDENGSDEMSKYKRTISNNPKFKEEEIALKKYFTEQVKAEEQRFRQWEQNIVNERVRLNADLEDIQKKVGKLEDQIKALQLKKR